MTEQLVYSSTYEKRLDILTTVRKRFSLFVGLLVDTL